MSDSADDLVNFVLSNGLWPGAKSREISLSFCGLEFDVGPTSPASTICRVAFNISRTLLPYKAGVLQLLGNLVIQRLDRLGLQLPLPIPPKLIKFDCGKDNSIGSSNVLQTCEAGDRSDWSFQLVSHVQRCTFATEPD